LHISATGQLLLGYRHSPQSPEEKPQRYGLSVRVSRDEGKTWGQETQLQDPKGTQYDRRRVPGYPDLVDLPGGEILVAYHGVQETDGKRSHYIAENVLRPASTR
jgi:hypothetical protein